MDGGPIKQQIAIVDIEQHAIIRTMQSNVEFTFGRLAWSPDGTHITAIGRRAWDGRANGGHGAYTGGSETVIVFDAHSGEKIASEELITSNSSLRYTPDGKYLIEGDMNAKGTGWGIRIWDGQHHELLQEIAGDVQGFAISADGHYFAAGGYKKISIWKLK